MVVLKIAIHHTHSLLCYAWWVCPLQSKSYPTLSQMDDQSFLALWKQRKEKGFTCQIILLTVHQSKRYKVAISWSFFSKRYRLQHSWGLLKEKFWRATWPWNSHISVDEMAANDKKMGQIPTGTWPTPQNAKQLYLKFRPGTYLFPLREPWSCH